MIVQAYTNLFHGIETFGFWNYIRLQRIVNRLEKSSEQNLFLFKWHTNILDDVSNDEWISFWYDNLINKNEDAFTIYSNVMLGFRKAIYIAE